MNLPDAFFINFTLQIQQNMKIDKDYIESLREDYSNGILEEHNVLPDPMKQFEKWLLRCHEIFAFL